MRRVENFLTVPDHRQEFSSVVNEDVLVELADIDVGHPPDAAALATKDSMLRAVTGWLSLCFCTRKSAVLPTHDHSPTHHHRHHVLHRRHAHTSTHTLSLTHTHRHTHTHTHTHTHNEKSKRNYISAIQLHIHARTHALDLAGTTEKRRGVWRAAMNILPCSRRSLRHTKKPRSGKPRTLTLVVHLPSFSHMTSRGASYM